MTTTTTTTTNRNSNYRKIPPLPFQGNKSIGKTKFINLVKSIPNGNEFTFVDLFGGSFYLSYLTHLIFPLARVVTNDFDNYRERLSKIRDTNQLLDTIRPLIKCNEKKRITDESKEKIVKAITDFDGYVDRITLSTNLIYSSAYIQDMDRFLKHEYYNLVNKNNYNEDVSDYIAGLEFRKCDWKILFDEFKDKDKVVFIADPPYLYSDKGGYQFKGWNVYDNLNVLNVLRQKNYIFYTSTKSGIFEILKFLKEQGIEYKTCNQLEYKRHQINRRNVDTTSELILYNFTDADNVENKDDLQKQDVENKDENKDDELVIAEPDFKIDVEEDN